MNEKLIKEYIKTAEDLLEDVKYYHRKKCWYDLEIAACRLAGVAESLEKVAKKLRKSKPKYGKSIMQGRGD